MRSLTSAPVLFVFALLPLVSVGCSPAPSGLARTPAGTGPLVRHEPFARPLPEVPFPNDLITRLDESSPTGRRLNVSLEATTANERRVRASLNELDGFGTSMPLTVSFDAPLDLDELFARQRDNDDFADDALFVVAIDPDSPDYGVPVPLDMDRGAFPPLLRVDETEYFPGDSRRWSEALLYETVNEDLNGDGILQGTEDTDSDGVLDRANVWPEGADPIDGLLTSYERQTDTLLLRPLLPLREQTRYAVILTSRLVGEGGEPVRSPFAYVHHDVHSDALAGLPAVLDGWRSERGIDLSLDDVAFAWTFTTQSVTRDLVALREGLHGLGPMAWLAGRFPAETEPAEASQSDAARSDYVLEGDALIGLTRLALGPAFELTAAQVDGLVEDLGHVDYVVQGSFASPDLLGSDPAPLYQQEWDLDVDAGIARADEARIPFTLVVPKPTGDHAPPFPIAIYGHGYGQARIEALAFSGILARYGIASMAIDAWGHGLNLSPADQELLLGLGEGLGFRPFLETMLLGRGRDLTGNGRIDAGADTFSSYAFHTRDTLRQSLLDHLQLVRMMRSWDGVTTWGLDQDGDGSLDLAGDWDGDGQVDAGGPQDAYLWGSSMGGIHSGVLGAIEPGIRATAPISGGAGLTALSSRSLQLSVRTETVMRALGPVIAGLPSKDGDTVEVSLYYPLAAKVRALPVGTLETRAGDRVRVRNLTLGTQDDAPTRGSGAFDLHLACDEGDRFQVELLREGQVIETLDSWPEPVFWDDPENPRWEAGAALATPGEGWGYRRGSPDLRRLVGLAQLILEPADPINYQRHFFAEPLDVQPEGPTPTDLLVVATIGDMRDPSDVHVAAARAAGILPLDEIDPRYGVSAHQWLIDNHVLEGLCGLDRFPPSASGEEVLFDPDGMDTLAGDNGFDAPGPAPGDELRMTRDTAGGVSGMRWFHMLPCGKHSHFVTNPAAPFNADEYISSMVADWFRSGGQRLRDDGCHEDSSCSLD